MCDVKKNWVGLYLLKIIEYEGGRKKNKASVFVEWVEISLGSREARKSKGISLNSSN